MPWVYTRRRLARAWGIRPREVDQEPIDEVLLELRLEDIEARAQQSQQSRGNLAANYRSARGRGGRRRW